MNKMTLGEYIRTLRMQNHMTQASLAEKLHITDKAVSKWERDISCPDISLFPRLADILGVSAGDLLRVCVDDGPASRLFQIFEMSHDVRTPIHIILGCADLLKTAADDPERRERYIDAIKASGQYLLERCEEIRQAAQKGRVEEPLKTRDIETYFKDYAEKPAAVNYAFPGKRVLIVEDIALNREIAGEIIRHTGARVAFAGDGAVCLDMLNQVPDGYFDLILMDLMMPNMDGFEAAKRIRQMENVSKSQIPIIAVSANVSQNDRAAVRAAGMNGFIEKPINVDALYEAMEQFLR